ncbi:TetR/AcrR family transcriptional regulator [Eggerthella lenta]|uniref:TetR/AcrR family transcriptional regulator n=1 Tax=Eggerthella lenta TaxID=84112 RepID=UPI001E28E843|nr:TetR family transcriptional regulator [Eggerthella lenta]MDB1746675.1 TetR family transcriptional regulator [Eggerthella lenta]
MEQTKPSAEGLRYRKKLKARLSVERAALELVIERGYDGVTVEDICARAEISKKTFFNYFPSKAAAIMVVWTRFPTTNSWFASSKSIAKPATSTCWSA